MAITPPDVGGEGAAGARAQFALTSISAPEGTVFYHGALVQTPKKERLQALTVRLPETEYRLLRALAFVTDESINDIVGMALNRVLGDASLRPGLEGVIKAAEELRPGRPVPRNPHSKGRRKEAR